MADDTTTQCWLFPGLSRKPVVIAFNEPLSSSDGGGLLLRAADQRLGLTRRMAECLRADRDPGRIRHEAVELLTQRDGRLQRGPEVVCEDILKRTPFVCPAERLGLHAS